MRVGFLVGSGMSPPSLPSCSLPLRRSAAAARLPCIARRARPPTRPPTHPTAQLPNPRPRQDGKSQVHGARPGQQAALGEEELAVLDDRSHFARVCAQLAACAGQQADESQLKVGAGSGTLSALRRAASLSAHLPQSRPCVSVLFFFLGAA